MDNNQQNQQPQAQNAMQTNMMQMPRQGQFPQGQPGYPMGGAMPQMNPQQQQQQFMQMQQMNAQGFFNQGQPGQGRPQPGPQGGQPGAPGAGGQGQQQYRAKPGFGGPGGPPNPNQMRGGNMQGILGLPNAVLDQMNKPGFMQAANNNSSPGPKQPREPTYSLYVGNLADTVFNLDLYKFFQAQGYKLKGARVMFDEQSRSKRYGYLNFHDEEESDRCLKEMNNATLSGKQIVLNKQINRDFDSNANLLVRNLPKTMDQKQLTELFSQHGTIGSCKLEIFANGESRCFGYVQFQKADDAQKAINALNNKEVDGSVISVLQHAKREDRGPAQSEHYTNLFLQNLPREFTAEDIKKEFSKYGDIQSAELGSKPGHGFVNFKDHESAKKALEEVHMKLKLDGHQAILAAPHKYKKESDLQPKGSFKNPIVQNQKEMFKSNIFVTGIPNDINADELEKEFSKAGAIASIKMKGQFQKDRDTGKSFQTHQTAFILFDDVKSAQKSIRLYDQTRPFPGQSKILRVDFWQAKDDLIEEKNERSQNLIKQILNLCKSQTVKSQYGMPNPPMQPGPGMMPQNMMGGPQPGAPQQDGNGGQQRQNYNNHGGNRGGYQNNNQRGGGNYRGNNRGNRGGNNNNRGGNRNNNQRQPQGGHQQPQMNNQQQQNMGGQAMPKQPQQLRLPQVDITPLDNLQGEERDNFVGNNIYPAIFQAYGEEEAPTITGMILDESAVDYKELLTNQVYFQQKVTQAHAIFKKSQTE